MTRTLIAWVLLFVLGGGAAAAQDFRPVTERSAFLDLLDGRSLRLALFAIELDVTADGKINGRALGSPVTGQWTWQDGYFCRRMDWSGTEIAQNCQLVEARGRSEMRFTVDRGAGDSAAFRLE